MPELMINVPVLKTTEELERAIKQYQASDLTVPELLCQWQAIRDASLNQDFSEPENDGVSDEESY
jgi:hypothetical protein